MKKFGKAVFAGCIAAIAGCSPTPAADPDCKDGALSAFLGDKCQKGNLVVSFKKDYEASGTGAPAAKDIQVMVVASGLVFQFPQVAVKEGDDVRVNFEAGFKAPPKSNFTGAMLMADAATVMRDVSIDIDLRPNVNNDQIGSAPLLLRGTLMNMTVGTLRTPTPVIRFSKFTVSFDGLTKAVTATPKFSLQFMVK